MLIHLIYIIENWSNTTMTTLKKFGYCSAVCPDLTTSSLFEALVLFPDAVCVGLMLWSSSSVLLILYRHKKRMLHVHNTSFLRSTHESRATKSILVSVSTFVLFYTISCIFKVCLAFIYNPNWFLVNMTVIVSRWLPTVSPFLSLSQDSSASTFSLVWIQKRKPPAPMTNIWTVSFCAILNCLLIHSIP